MVDLRDRALTLITGVLLLVGFVLLLVPNFASPYSQAVPLVTVRTNDTTVPEATLGPFGACMSFFMFQSSAGYGTEPCTKSHDGYTFVAFLTFVLPDSLGENSGVTEVRTIPVQLLAQEDTQGLILFAVSTAIGGLGSLTYGMASWKRWKWTRIGSLVLVGLGAVMGFVAFAFAKSLADTITTRLATYNTTDTRRFSLTTERGAGVTLVLVGSIVWSLAVLLGIADICLERWLHQRAVLRREQDMSIELHQKEAAEEGMSYEAKAQRYMPVQLVR